MSPYSDKRTYERIPFAQKVRVIPAGKAVAYAVVINIGMGGILLGAASPLPVGSHCKVAIPLPDGEGAKRLLADGTVVRGEDGGTAIQFLKAIEPSRFNTLFQAPAAPTQLSLWGAYQAYFQVSRNPDLANCEKLLGVSKRTFRTTFYITFASCIFLAILPAWLFRNGIPAAPNWIKVILSFGYGAVWLGLIQPTIDLTVFRVLKSQHSPRSNA